MKRLLIVLALVAAACGGSDDPAPPAGDATTVTTGGSEETTAPTTSTAPVAGSAGITLTVGDDTWEFPGALCAFTGPRPGEDGSQWNVSFVQDGAQVYISDDEFGQLIEYDDISNGGDPAFSWASVDSTLSMEVDGNDITATADFVDDVTGTGPLAGTLTASCNDWFEG